MDKLMLVKKSQFGSLVCDYYGDNNGEFFMTRQQIGEALGYDNPMIAIAKIHDRHKDRIDKYSVLTKLTGTDGKRYETYLYSAKGVYEICRWSRQPAADAFYDHVYAILEGLRIGYIELTMQQQTAVWKDTRTYAKEIRRQEAEIISELVEYAVSQGSTHANRYYSNLSKLADKAAGITEGMCDNSTIAQLGKLALVEQIIGRCIHSGIEQGIPYRAIYAACREKIEDFQAVVPLAG